MRKKIKKKTIKKTKESRRMLDKRIEKNLYASLEIIEKKKGIMRRKNKRELER